MHDKNALAIVICPPYPQFEEGPSDQSRCQLVECPHCKNKMWLSEKKKGVIQFAAVMCKRLLISCYDCIEKVAKDNPELFRDSERVDI